MALSQDSQFFFRKARILAFLLREGFLFWRQDNEGDYYLQSSTNLVIYLSKK